MTTDNEISISQARRAQVARTAQNMVNSFVNGIGPDLTADQFNSIFHPEIEWFDHAFLIRRVGHEAVLGLHQAWRHCNQPFEAKIKAR